MTLFQISEEFEEELEPQLKYEKLGAELREISSNEKTTCMRAYPRLFDAFLTLWVSPKLRQTSKCTDTGSSDLSITS